jgi:predicted ATPase
MAARTSETSVDNYFTRQYIPEDNSELHTRHRENLKSHKMAKALAEFKFRHLGKHFMEPSDYDELSLYFKVLIVHAIVLMSSSTL